MLTRRHDGDKSAIWFIAADAQRLLRGDDCNNNLLHDWQTAQEAGKCSMVEDRPNCGSLSTHYIFDNKIDWYTPPFLSSD